MSIATGILQFKQDVDDVYKAGKLDPIASSECLNGNVSDVVISVNDVLPIEHSVGCKVASKNLLVVTPIRKLKANFNECYFLPKGTYTISMNFTNATSWRFTITLYDLNGTLITDSTTNTTHLKGISKVLNYSSGNGGIYQHADNVVDNYLTIETDNDYYIGINFYFGNTTADTTVTNPQLELGSTATEYTPYTSNFEGVEVSRYGKNLFDVPSMVTFKGVLDYKNVSFLKAGVTYVFYYDAATFDTESEGIVVNVYDGGAVFLKPQQAWRVTPKIDNPRMIVYSNGFDWNQSQGTTATITNFRICIADANYLEYEPYIEPTVYTANADGTVDGIISISPNMTLLSNNDAVSINAKYYKDPDIVMSNLQQSVALSGGE